MNNLVFKGQNNQALTNSLLVAEKFGKEHRHVLDAIYNLFVSAENSAQTNNQQLTKMFALVEYDVPLNNGTGAVRKAPMYVMNRDGFTLLAMGFTGEKALKFKLDYINAFNQMEETIKSGGHHVPGSFREALLLAAEQQARNRRTAEYDRSQPPQSFVCRGGGDIATLLSHWRAGKKNPQSKRNQYRAKQIVPIIER